MNATHKTIVTTFVMSFMICTLALTLTLLMCQVSNATTNQNVTWNDYKSMIEVTQVQTGVMGIIIEDAQMTDNTSLINQIEKLLENKTFAVNIEDNVFDCSETSRSTALYLTEMGFNVKIANNLNFNTSSPYYGVGHCWAVVIDDQEGGVLAIETRLKSKSIGRIMTKNEAPLYYTAWLIEPAEYNRIHQFEPPLPRPDQVICDAPADEGA